MTGTRAGESGADAATAGIVSRRELLALLGTWLTGCGYTPATLPIHAIPVGSAPTHMDALRAAPSPTREPPIVDLHCHTFNARDIPIDGFIRSLAQGYGLPELVDSTLAKLTGPFHDFLVKNTPLDPLEKDGAAPREHEPYVALADECNDLGSCQTPLKGKLKDLEGKYGLTVLESIRRYVEMAGTATHTRLDMAKLIVQANSPSVQGNEASHCPVRLFTPALVDFEFWISDNKRARVKGATTSLREQVEFHGRVSGIAAKNADPGLKGAKFHPFVPFNPRRELEAKTDSRGFGPAMQLVDSALNVHGFVGVKLYPASGFKPIGNEHLRDFKRDGLGARLDVALRRLFDYCQTHSIPILTHASPGNGFKPDAAWRGSPWAWRHVLEEYPSLRVCFGHFGGLEGMTGEGAPLECVSWAEGFLSLILEYDNVYADISDCDGGLSEEKPRTAFQRKFLAWFCAHLGDEENGPKVAQRLAYGSDWWMNVRDGMGENFLPKIREMVDQAMAPACKKLEGGKRPVKFKEDFFCYNALRFLGILDDKGVIIERDGSTVARLAAVYNSAEDLKRWIKGEFLSDAVAG